MKRTRTRAAQAVGNSAIPPYCVDDLAPMLLPQDASTLSDMVWDAGPTLLWPSFWMGFPATS